MNAADKTRQKWSVTAGTKFTQPGPHSFRDPCRIKPCYTPGSLGLEQPLQLAGPERLDARLLVLPPFLLGRLEPVDVDRDEVDDGELDEAGEGREEAGREPSACDVRKILGFLSTPLFIKSRNLMSALRCSSSPLP